MKFEEGLKAVLKKIEINETDHKNFLDDVETITTEINKAMEANNSIFKDMMKGLKTTALYTKDSVIDVTDNMQLILDFKLPFKVKVVNEGDGLKLKTTVIHPIVRQGFVDVDIFYFLMKGNLELVISKMKPILCKNDRNFKLNIDFPIIFATEQVEVGCKSRIEFMFSTVLSFEMGEGSQGRQYVCITPGLPSKIMNNEFKNQNAGLYGRDVYRLLKMLQIKYSDGEEIKSNLVIFGSVVDSIASKSVKTSLGLFLLESLKKIVTVEEAAEKEPRICCFSFKTIFFKNIKKLFRDIMYYHLMDSVELEDMLALFKLP